MFARSARYDHVHNWICQSYQSFVDDVSIPATELVQISVVQRSFKVVVSEKEAACEIKVVHQAIDLLRVAHDSFAGEAGSGGHTVTSACDVTGTTAHAAASLQPVIGFHRSTIVAKEPPVDVQLGFVQMKCLSILEEKRRRIDVQAAEVCRAAKAHSVHDYNGVTRRLYDKIIVLYLSAFAFS